MSNENIAIKRTTEKKRLGKGLSALLGVMDDDIFSTHSSAAVLPDSENLKGYSVISIQQIIPNKFQPRKFFAEEELSELAASIKENGVLQPILVRRLEGGNFEIIAGERRFRASMLAGLSEMPCIIRDLNDEQVFILAVIENVQRENLNPLEEAESYSRLIKEFSYTQEEVGRLVNKSRSHISNIIRLTALPESLKQMVMEGKLTGGHVRPLLALKSEEQILAVADVIFQNNYSVRKVEELINLILNDEEKLETLEHNLEEVTKIVNKKSSEEISQFLVEFSKAFEQKFELPVKIKPSKKGGVISIKYKTQEDLHKIMNGINHQMPKQKPFTLPEVEEFVPLDMEESA